MYKKSVLNNGLTVATLKMPSRVSCSLGIWIKVGSRYEKAKIGGISHFLEHLLFKGTASRTCEEIKQAIEGIGGTLNAFTSEEVTCYLAKVPGKHVASALAILWDMVLHARLNPQDIEMERKVILEEIRMYKDLPAHYVSELLVELLWPEQPLGANIAGEAESVRAISRAGLLKYRNRFYCLNNIVVVACGNVNHDVLLKECRQIGSKTHLDKPGNFPKAKIAQRVPQLKVQVKDTEQTHLALGVHGLARMDDTRYALELLHVILGANMSSRLFREIREERGLAYAIGTGVKYFKDTGAFIVHAGVDSKRLDEALEVISGQLKEVKKNLVGADELRRAKEYYIGQISLTLENTSEHMVWLGENIVCAKELTTPAESIKRIEKVKAGEIRAVAKDILRTQSLNLALIGPLKSKEQRKIKERLVL